MKAEAHYFSLFYKKNARKAWATRKMTACILALSCLFLYERLQLNENHDTIFLIISIKKESSLHLVNKMFILSIALISAAPIAADVLHPKSEDKSW